MACGRFVGNAELLPSGKVVIAGGIRNSTCPAASILATDIFDPVTQTFTAGPTSHTGEYTFSSTLTDGRVLVGGPSNVVEAFRPGP
jgi:hypothetical protein